MCNQKEERIGTAYDSEGKEIGVYVRDITPFDTFKEFSKKHSYLPDTHLLQSIADQVVERG